ncbi:MAG: HD-GYP domain-containing protein [Ilumatobacteraceae bacterium]
MTDLSDHPTPAASPFDSGPEGRPVGVTGGDAPPSPRFGDRFPGLARLAGAWVVLVSVQLLLSWSGDVLVVEHPGVLAAAVIVAAGLCVVAALVLLVVAHVRDQAELGVLGVVFLAISLLPLVHGITTPGVWFGPNSSSAVAVLVAPLLASGAVAPVVFRGARWSRWLMRRWRSWTAGWLVVVTNAATLLLAAPTLFSDPRPRSEVTIGAAVLSVVVFLALSVRHAKLSWAGGGRRSMAVATGFAWVGAAQLVWVGKVPYSLGFWVSHLFDTVGVAFGVVAAIGVSREGAGVDRMLRPIIVEDPVEAFAVGLDPVVRQHLEVLDRRDAQQRDHAIRTAELALRVGRRLGLAAHELRGLGVAALLHDIGHGWLPEHVVHPTGRLSFEDEQLLRSHAERGERMLAASRVTASVASTVRSHHEHVDGTGYPDGLRGGQITQPARILAVVDAYDDLVHPSAQVAALSPSDALHELITDIGRKWDADVVSELVAMHIEDEPPRDVLADALSPDAV